MKKIMLLIAIATLISMEMTTPVWAQKMERSKLGNTVITQRTRRFNPATVETIAGKVVQVEQRDSQGWQSGMGVHVSVKTAQETVDVHLGPSWYLEDRNFSLKSGNQVEITGSRVTDASQPTLIAAKVKSGDTVLTLRDKNGLPVWRGMNPGRRRNRN